MVDISIILTGHREGLVSGVTARSAMAAIDKAQYAGLTVELIVVLDKPDEDTRLVLENAFADQTDDVVLRYLEVDTGDPGQSRNLGIEEAKGTCSTFLDGDDLWSSNWLVASWELIKARPDVVAQSMCNVTFGLEKTLWWHVDSEGPLFDPRYLEWLNYWDAMSFARTEIYRRYPYRKNDLALGFGHEDWFWSVTTYNAGIHHKPVLETMHFKRRRRRSQMSKVANAGAVVWYD